MQDNLTENWYWYKRMPEGTVCIFRIDFYCFVSFGFEPMHKHREWNNHITVCNSILLFDVLYRVAFRQERFYRE